MSEPLQISVHVEEKRYQPTQEKTVIPDWDAKTVTPDKGYALSKVTVEGMPEPTESETFTENGTYDVGRIGTAVVDVDIDLQEKTVTPAEQTQTVEADQGYDGLRTVTVHPIPPEYVVPTGIVEITENGQGIDVAGKATANVNVPQGVFPSGTKLITENVTGEDVTNYAAVDVAVPGPSGTKQVTITANGTTTEDVTDYADAEITVNTLPEKGLVFEDYDADGFPHSARFVGTWSGVLPFAMDAFFALNNFQQKIEEFEFPEGITDFTGNYTIRFQTALKKVIFPTSLLRITDIFIAGSTNLETVIFKGKVPNIGNRSFNNNTKTILYDFSHTTAIPVLPNTTVAINYAPGCVIRIPAALSDITLGEGNGWESATNWIALTNIVWEVV